MTGRVLVTGSRSWTDYPTMLNALRPWKRPGAVLVHGGARGADRMAAAIWRAWGLTVEEHDADWHHCGPACPAGQAGHRRIGRNGQEYCPTAGHRRNQAMIDAGATVCLAFIRDGSPGATHCAKAAEAAGIPTRRHLATSAPASARADDAARRQGQARQRTTARADATAQVQLGLWEGTT